MRAIVLTSTMRRHVFVANTLAARLDVVARVAGAQVVRAAALRRQRRTTRRSSRGTSTPARRRRTRSSPPTTPCAARRRSWSTPGGCNDPDAIEAMRAHGPGRGAGVRHGPAEAAAARPVSRPCLNIHLGLSPVLPRRGHQLLAARERRARILRRHDPHLDAGVDTGPIIAHVRPDIAAGDGPHDIGNKTIVAAASALADAADALHARPAERRAAAGRRPRLQARRLLGRRRAPPVRQLRQRHDAEYLRQPRARDAALSLVPMGAAPS